MSDYETDNVSLIRANTTASYYGGDVNENSVDVYSNLFFPHIQDNGGNYQNIGLTIDVLNKETLEENTENLVNKDWVNSERLRNNLSTYKAVWGFKETHHSQKESRSISNGFCFGGQVIEFYIALKGDGAGNIDGEWVYCKTNLTVKAVDIINNTETTLYTFDDFEVDKDDSSRYFSWTVPAINNPLFASYGLFGLCVISLDIDYTYYSDAQRTILYDVTVPHKNQAHLQILSYSAAKEIIEVNAGDLDIVNTVPDYTDSLYQIFAKTVFNDLEPLNLNALTVGQKRAIIADQIASLFISQHTVVTADYYPSKIIGFGVSEAVFPVKILEKAITYSKKYPEIIPLVNDRLYGMIATFKAFNFINDIDKFIADLNQSSQLIRDPVRAIYISSDGIIKDKLGINGLIFNPFSINVVNAEVTCPPKSQVFSIGLYENLVDISDILITNSSGGNITPFSQTVKVAFTVVYGSSSIKQIRYRLMTQNELNFVEYLDSLGTSRSYTFTLPNRVITDPSNNGDILIAQIDIEDIEGGVVSFINTKFVNGYTEMPSLRDLKIYQRNTGDGVADFYFTYDGVGEINASYLYIEYSVDGGITWTEIDSDSIKGDVQNTLPGRKRISWIAKDQLLDVEMGTLVFCRLTVYDADIKMAVGNVLSGALIWNFDKPEVAVRRLSIKEDEEMYESSTSSYSSSSSSSYSSSSSSPSSSSWSSYSSSSSSSSISSSSSTSYIDLTVTQTGPTPLTPDVSGYYFEDGVYNGLPAYRNATSTYWIWYTGIGVNAYIISPAKGDGSGPIFFIISANPVGVYTTFGGASGTPLVT